MPQMPDPISRCPIFDRLETVTSSDVKVHEGIVWMSTYNNHFVKAGRKMEVLSDELCWHLPATPNVRISEVQYLSTFFFPPDGWWKAEKKVFAQKHGMSFFDKFGEEIADALAVSHHISERYGIDKVPIQGYWECVGSDISIKQRAMPRRKVVWFRVQTPPPEDDYICAP